MVNFLDRLRENRVMPEPRDYRTWRNSIAELEAAAKDGTYSETWSLPDGHTYHVTGRPHPDGAVALLFEDISAEMSLTRRFRAELEQSQSVIDSLEDGVAMFSAAGQLILTNKAYCDIWSADESANAIGADVNDVTRHWHKLAVPTPTWGDFREFTQRSHDREEWQAVVALKDGRNLVCRFLPQKGGGTLAVFRLTSSGRLTRDGLQKVV
jgi:PAS domain-containing protein